MVRMSSSFYEGTADIIRGLLCITEKLHDETRLSKVVHISLVQPWPDQIFPQVFQNKSYIVQKTISTIVSTD